MVCYRITGLPVIRKMLRQPIIQYDEQQDILRVSWTDAAPARSTKTTVAGLSLTYTRPLQFTGYILADAHARKDGLEVRKTLQSLGGWSPEIECQLPPAHFKAWDYSELWESWGYAWTDDATDMDSFRGRLLTLSARVSEARWTPLTLEEQYQIVMARGYAVAFAAKCNEKGVAPLFEALATLEDYALLKYMSILLGVMWS